MWPGLLAAEHAALAVERLEHVAVADVGRERRGSRARASARGSRGSSSAVTATRSTPRSSARIATIWSPSTSSPCSSTASIRSPSPSNATPRSSPPLDAPSPAAARVSVAPQPTLMFEPSGRSPIACTSAPSRSNALGGEARVGAVGAVDDDAQPGEVGAEVLEHVVEVALAAPPRASTRRRARRRRARRAAPRSAPRRRR